MIFNRIIAKNYKKFSSLNLNLNKDINIFVGNNECGKSTLLEIISVVTTCKLGAKQLQFNISKDFFNKSSVDQYLLSINEGKPQSPPEILMELYAIDDSLSSQYKGKNNSLHEDCPGLKIEIIFDEQYNSIYQKMIAEKKLKDLPVEFYKVRWTDFDDQLISVHNNPCSVSLIDTSKNNYNNLVDGYINEEITTILSTEELTTLGMAYRQNRVKFSEEELLAKLNDEITKKSLLPENKITLSLKDTLMNEWKKDLSLDLDQIPFYLSGKGTQNTLKTNLALNKVKEKANVLLIEEPENHLSYANMNKLISNITIHNQDKQIFITTHSNFVANKIGLEKIIMIENNIAVSFNDINQETVSYFKKLPGYDTLRMILSKEPILVEGPSDELIIQRAYKDLNDKLPIENGIDVISVRGLSFKRFCDIAKAINKDIRIITDNDGDKENRIIKKYKEYEKYKNIKIFFQEDNDLYSLEPNIVSANAENLKNLSLILFNEELGKEELIKKMESDKTDWALKIFESNKKIQYPQYIQSCVTYE